MHESGERRRVLEGLQGGSTAVAQVLRYCENHFDLAQAPPSPVFPLPDEPHVGDWRAYPAGSGEAVFRALQERLPQLCIPIGAGVSTAAAYASVVRAGQPFRSEDFGGRLTLERPDLFRLDIYDHPAGALPVLSTPHRPDFEDLDRALARCSEPVPVNPSVNAHIIAGFVNWDRVHRYRLHWSAQAAAGGAAPQAWAQEMRRVAREEKWRFQDRLLLLCAQPYSSVSAAELDLPWDAEIWLERSRVLRTEHEFTHYTTKRLYGRMSLNLLDETLADWAGMTLAMGGFEASWFLRFLGLDSWPPVRSDGRIHTYTGELEGEAFELLCALTVRAAHGLAALTRSHYSAGDRLRFLLALSRLTLELMASDERERFFHQACEEVAPLLRHP